MKPIIWNRRIEKASSVIDEIREEGRLEEVSFKSNEQLEEAVAMADIPSCATNAEEGLVIGADLKEGVRLDVVGLYKHSMKECGDIAITQGRVFFDNNAAAVEAGELVGAFQRGFISRDHIQGTLLDLIAGLGCRNSAEEITVFKSVGSAVVDLLSAQLVNETHISPIKRQ